MCFIILRIQKQQNKFEIKYKIKLCYQTVIIQLKAYNDISRLCFFMYY